MRCDKLALDAPGGSGSRPGGLNCGGGGRYACWGWSWGRIQCTATGVAGILIDKKKNMENYAGITFVTPDIIQNKSRFSG